MSINIDGDYNLTGIKVCKDCHKRVNKHKRIDTINENNEEETYCLDCYNKELDMAVANL